MRPDLWLNRLMDRFCNLWWIFGSATVCCSSNVREDLDFVPLSVEYNEKYYAAGKIPGGFIKREGKPKDKEILVSRLIDRPMRPLLIKDLVEKFK